jgi:hypothetical protein
MRSFRVEYHIVSMFPNELEHKRDRHINKSHVHWLMQRVSPVSSDRHTKISTVLFWLFYPPTTPSRGCRLLALNLAYPRQPRCKLIPLEKPRSPKGGSGMPPAAHATGCGSPRRCSLSAIKHLFRATSHAHIVLLVNGLDSGDQKATIVDWLVCTFHQHISLRISVWSNSKLNFY